MAGVRIAGGERERSIIAGLIYVDGPVERVCYELPVRMLTHGGSGSVTAAVGITKRTQGTEWLNWLLTGRHCTALLAAFES